MELPNIMSKLNEALVKEIDTIANNAIANSYIPMISNSLVGLDKDITLSFLLKEIINELNPDRDVYDEFSFEYEKHDSYDWLSCVLYTPENNYEFTHSYSKNKRGRKTEISTSFISF